MSIYRSGTKLEINDDGVTIQQLRLGTGATVLLANGFGSQSLTGWDRWQRAVNEAFPGQSVFRIRWEAQLLKSLDQLYAALETGGDLNKILSEAKRQVLGPIEALLAGKKPAMPLAGIVVEAPSKWIAAKQRATETGIALAEALAVSGSDEKYILLGFSLGARVMATAALKLAELGVIDKLESVHLVGGALNQSEAWLPIADATEQGVWNYFSRNDSVLSMLYRTAEVGAVPVGLSGFKLDSVKIHDVDVSDAVFTHRGYLGAISFAV
jgi:pimeloyl-ACP methyl ester carboxylesterase